MPLIPRVQYGSHIRKGAGPFDERRALGLGWEACVKMLWREHTLDVASVRLRPDQQGPLQVLVNGAWVDRQAIDVELTQADQDFLSTQVQTDFRIMASVGYWPHKPDAPTRSSHAPTADGAYDFVGCFVSGKPVCGKTVLERKFMFEGANWDKRIQELKRKTHKQFLGCQATDAHVKGQLLLITSVFRRKNMWTGLYFTSGGSWKTLTVSQHDGLVHLSVQENRFEKAWAKYRKFIVNEEEHVEVNHFLKDLGIRSKDVTQKVDAWTREKGAGSLGLKKHQHFIKHGGSLKPGKSPWVAPKAVLLKVWLHLNK